MSNYKKFSIAAGVPQTPLAMYCKLAFFFLVLGCTKFNKEGENL